MMTGCRGIGVVYGRDSTLAKYSRKAGGCRRPVDGMWGGGRLSGDSASRRPEWGRVEALTGT